jgi:hypothetical protein
VNERGQRLHCSHWEPEEYPEGVTRLPCVIYMHGNSSARVEALPQLSLCLSLGLTVLSFDFSGSGTWGGLGAPVPVRKCLSDLIPLRAGMSDGDFVSLGYYEREDLKAVIDYLRWAPALALHGGSGGGL